MPIYEYEPVDRECLLCEGTVEVFQSSKEENLKYCPQCGLEVKRVISRASFKVESGFSHEKAASRGFTTWKRAEKGKWEKVAGQGVDVIQGSPEDMARVEADKKSKTKVFDLDKET